MILIDPRAGSRDLVAPLAAAGVPVEEQYLDFGDLAFMGRGVQGAPLFLGIEHKKLPDLVQSLASDRLLFQLTGTPEHPGGMFGMYDRQYLIIEGEWDHDVNGRIVTASKLRRAVTPLKGAPPAAVLEQRILTLETRAGLRVRWTRSQKETIRYVSALYRFWTDRDLDEHRSHLAIHAPDFDRSLVVPHSRQRLFAAMLPGVGYHKSEAVAKQFSSLSIEDMAALPASEWMKVEGIGKKLAADIVKFCKDKGVHN